MIEVKPEKETKPPVQKRKTKRYIQESVTYIINQSKWKAATEFCKDHGWEFKVVTEKDLGI
jgi:4-hydroxyphenylpyruvate dioxygenase-like putative hemolysin